MNRTVRRNLRSCSRPNKPTIFAVWLAAMFVSWKVVPGYVDNWLAMEHSWAKTIGQAPEADVREGHDAALPNGMQYDCAAHADEFNTRLSLKKVGCDAYLRARGFVLAPVNAEEQAVSLAFNLKVYHNYEQAERLLRLIYRPQNFYCIHVDARSGPQLYAALAQLLSCSPLNANVFLSAQRARVHWGEFSTVLAELHCMDDLIRRFAHRWTYLINLTGEEFPLHTNLELVRLATVLAGRNWIGFFKAPNYFGQSRLTYVRQFNEATGQGRRTSELNKAVPLNVTICKGDVAALYSHEFVDYLLHNESLVEYMRWCRRIYIADEHCFQSLHCSAHVAAPGGYRGVVTDKWQNFPREKWLQRFAHKQNCASYWLRQICIFDSVDMTRIIAKAENRAADFKIFANKILWPAGRNAYSCLERYIVAKTQAVELNWTVEEIRANVLKDKRVANCDSYASVGR